MPKQIDYSLSDEEVMEVQKAMKSANAKVAKRACILHALHQGYKATEIAAVQAVTAGTVYNIYHRYQSEGIAGLSNKAKAGRPPKADLAYRQRLQAVLETDPHTLGLGFSVWTLPSLQAFMERETGIRLSQNRISEVLKDEGYVYRRPKQDLGHRQDPKLREQVRDALDEVKKTPVTGISSYSIWTKAGSV